jgi:hypothetical protein
VEDLDRRLAQLAPSQHSLGTVRQLDALGLTAAGRRHRVRVGTLEPAGRSVLRIAGSAETFEQRSLAAVLDAGPTAVASRHTAAALAGLDGFARPGEKGTIHVTVLGRWCRRRKPFVLVHRTAWLPATDVRPQRQVPCTAMARTVIDLAAHPEVSDRGLGDAIDSAIRLGLLTEDALRRRIALLGGSGRAGTRRLVQLLDWRPDGGTESALERAFLELCDEAGLPRPATQVVVRRPSGGVARVDVLFRGSAIVVEVSGHRTHSSRRAREADAQRQRDLRYQGLTVLEFTGDEVFGDPARVVDELRRQVRPLIA